MKWVFFRRKQPTRYYLDCYRGRQLPLLMYFSKHTSTGQDVICVQHHPPVSEIGLG